MHRVPRDVRRLNMSAIQQGLLASYASGSSPISLLAHAVAQGNVSATTDPIDTSGATLLVACVDCIAAARTVTDTKSNTWVPLTFYIALSLPTSQIFYCKNPIVGSNHQFTLTCGNASIGVLAFNHTDITANADGDVGVDANASTVQAAALTPSQNNSVVVSMLGTLGTGHTIDGGFTIVDNLDQIAGTSGITTAYLVQTTAAATHPTWTQGSGVSGGLSTASTSFKHS